MFRALTAASIIALTMTTAQADPSTAWGSRAPQNAQEACGPLIQSKPGGLYYRTWYKDCMRAANAKIERLEARMNQSRAFASK